MNARDSVGAIFPTRKTHSAVDIILFLFGIKIPVILIMNYFVHYEHIVKYAKTSPFSTINRLPIKLVVAFRPNEP